MEQQANGDTPTVIFRSNTLPTPLRNQWRGSSASGVMEAFSPSPNSPVPLRILSSTAKTKRAQNLRNSVAITNSDYYNSRRPQLALLQLSSGYQYHSTQALNTISEYEATDTFHPEFDRSNSPLFRYNPNAVRDPSRQTVPHPLSRSLSSLPGSSRPTSPQSQPQPQPPNLKSPPLPPPPAPLAPVTLQVPTIQEPVKFDSLSRTPSQRKMPFGEIPFNESTEEQFQPLYLNRQSGRLYMLESGFYTPLSDDQLHKLKCNQPPAADRRLSFRTVQNHPTPPDHLGLSQLLLVLFLICLNLPVTLVFSIPAIVCSLKARRAGREGRIKDANWHSKFVICLNSTAIIFHILIVLGVIAAILSLHFALDAF